MRPAACLRARSSRSCSSLSSKSSRSSVAACSITPQARRVAESARTSSESKQRHGSPEHVGEHGEPELQREQPQDAVEQTLGAATRATSCGAPAVCVSATTSSMIELAHVQRDDRQQRAQQPQRALRERQRGIGLPDEPQRTAAGCEALRSARAATAASDPGAASRAARQARGRPSNSAWAFSFARSARRARQALMRRAAPLLHEPAVAHDQRLPGERVGRERRRRTAPPARRRRPS